MNPIDTDRTFTDEVKVGREGENKNQKGARLRFCVSPKKVYRLKAFSMGRMQFKKG